MGTHPPYPTAPINERDWKSQTGVPSFFHFNFRACLFYRSLSDFKMGNVDGLVCHLGVTRKVERVWFPWLVGKVDCALVTNF